MGRRTGSRDRNQGKSTEESARETIRQLMLPMMDGFLATKAALFGMVQQAGVAVMKEFFEDEATIVAGPKGRHRTDRAAHRWGSTDTEFPFAGRKVSIRRPRVRAVNGAEIRLPRIEELRQNDPVSERVVDQILLGVSTRNYSPSLGAAPPQLKTRGASKSSVSRHVVRETRTRVEGFLSQRLEKVDLLALMVDGIRIAEQTVVVALGIAADGTKHPLGLWLGSTENSTICTELLQDLLARGLKVEGRILCIIDGGKGLRKALDDVFGKAALIQRCQLHKLRNLREHLPEKRHAYVLKTMNDAYRAATVATARKQLVGLVRWLEMNGEDSAAASLREGLEETLTILKLDISPTLRRSLATTNAIENLMGAVRRVTKNVKRWRDSSMIRRWVGLGIATAQKRFRRIKGHRNLDALRIILRRSEGALEVEAVAA